jgi:acyl carrier protein
LIRQTSLPITSSGKVQRMLCRQQYEAAELKVVHAWTNPAAGGAAAKFEGQTVRLHGEGVSWSAPASKRSQQKGSARRRRSLGSVELDRASERIEAWMLDWLTTRLGLAPDDISRDRPFAEYGVDSLTAVELSHELEQQFSVPLPPIVAWNYPTPATLARFLAEESLGIQRDEPSESKHAANGIAKDSANANSSDDSSDDELAALLAEVENLSDAEAAKLLAQERQK